MEAATAATVTQVLLEMEPRVMHVQVISLRLALALAAGQSVIQTRR